MEYFDFDQAARDDVASDCQEVGDADSIFYNDYELPDVEAARASNPSDALDNSNNINSGPQPGANAALQPEPVYPMHRSEESCTFCRAMGLDCFVAQRGVFQPLGCTCCIALYRKCSFTHDQPQGKFMNTLHVVGEDAPVQTGTFTGLKTLRSLNGPSNGQQKKSGARFSKDAIKVLKTWLSDHLAHPYPTDEEKVDLKEKTGLKKTQISNWLANARRRGKARSPFQSELGTPAIHIPRKTLPPGVNISELTPLERWKHSPPENEAASPRDILQAMAITSFASGKENPPPENVRSNSRRTGSSNDDGSFPNVRPKRSSSGHSLNMSKSSISEMSFASAFSNRSSRESFASGETKERRRRRHKSAVGANPFQKVRGARPFQCTFCTDTFGTKYDWQRHEKSLHLALDQWICSPHGGIIRADGKSICTFCRHPNPDQDHLESHNYEACQEKTTQERIFYRKDHLNQHLRLMHNVKLGAWMESWKSTITDIKSRCGFCSATFGTWKERADHLAAHFKAGAQMKEWKGDWGFGPHIQKMIENAMPPYLIGEDRNSMHPFLASRQSKATEGPGAEPSTPSLPVPYDANCYERLEVELSSFVTGMIVRGEIPTDEMIQGQARKVIYGNAEDPWNQTCADNPIWLAVFKQNLGLRDLPGTENVQLKDLGMRPPYAAPGGLRQPPSHALGTATRTVLTSTYSSSGGMHSAVSSMQNSLSSSLAGSHGVPFGGSGSWGFSGCENSSLSTPAQTAMALKDPTRMDHYADYTQKFCTGFGDSGRDIDDINNMQLDSLFDAEEMLNSAGFCGAHLMAPPAMETVAPFTDTTCTQVPPAAGPFDSGYNAPFNPSYSHEGGFPQGGFHTT